jgi:hypothetical protein
MIGALPLAVALSAVFALSGALALVCVPGGVRPLAELAQPAMSAAMLAMTWTRPGTLALVWPAVLGTAFAGGFVLDAVRRQRAGARGGPDSSARAVTAAASVWMLVAGPAGWSTAGLGAVLVATSAFWAARALRPRTRPRPRTDAGCHALMGLGMTTMLLAMTAGW